MSLWDIARQVTDEVCGPGTYAEVNRGNRDPRVQEQVAISEKQVHTDRNEDSPGETTANGAVD